MIFTAWVWGLSLWQNLTGSWGRPRGHCGTATGSSTGTRRDGPLVVIQWSLGAAS